MSDIANLIQTTLKGIGKVGSTLLGQEATTQLNAAERQISAAHYDFFTSLSTDPDVSNYSERLSTELHNSYALVADSLTNPYARRDFESFIEGQKEADRQRMLTLQARNAPIFGGQELVTSLDAVLASGVTPGDDLDTYRTKSIGTINGLIARNLASGIINEDRAAELSREYTQDFNYGFSRDLAYESARTLLQGNMSASDTTDLLTQAIRAEGATFDEIVGGSDLTGLSAGATVRLGELSAAYRNVELTPDEEEKLVRDLRTEVKAMESTFTKQADEQAEVNDIELTKLWASSDEGKRKIAENDFAMLDEMYGDDFASKAKWIADYGAWDAKETEAAERRDQEAAEQEKLREYDVRIEGARATGDVEEIGAIRSDILSDTLDDAKRNGMLSTLKVLENEATQTESSTAEYDSLLAEFDVSIVDQQDMVRENKGSITQIKQLRRNILTNPMMVENEEDRNQRVSILNGLLDDIRGAAPEDNANTRRVTAESEIGLLYSDASATPRQVREAIRAAESAGSITGDDAFSWYNRIENREEVLGNAYSVNALDVINRTFDARIRSVNITEEERAQLAQEQATAFNMYDSFINNPDLRQMSPAQQKEAYDDLVSAALAPAAAREVLGLSLGPEAAAGSYRNFQEQSPEVAATLVDEIRQEWVADMRLEFADQPFIANVSPGGRGLAIKTTVEDGKNVLILRHNESGVQFTKRRKRGAGLGEIVGIEPEAWWVLFPGDDEWQKWDEDTATRMEGLR
jgi:hypothetical protein